MHRVPSVPTAPQVGCVAGANDHPRHGIRPEPTVHPIQWRCSTAGQVRGFRPGRQNRSNLISSRRTVESNQRTEDPCSYRDCDMNTGHFRAAGNGNSPDFGEYWICDPPTARRLTWTDHLFGVEPWPSHQDLVLAAVISPRAGSDHRRTPRPRPGRTRRTGCPACRRTSRCRVGRRTRRERLRD